MSYCEGCWALQRKQDAYADELINARDVVEEARQQLVTMTRERDIAVGRYEGAVAICKRVGIVMESDNQL